MMQRAVGCHVLTVVLVQLSEIKENEMLLIVFYSYIVRKELTMLCYIACSLQSLSYYLKTNVYIVYYTQTRPSQCLDKLNSVHTGIHDNAQPVYILKWCISYTRTVFGLIC